MEIYLQRMNFKNEKPREYALYLEDFFGPPTIVGKKVVGWEDVPKPYTRIEVRDEYIKHTFPAQHYDFIYSYAKIPLTPEIAGKLLKVTGSILVDLLKGEVGARCEGLTANDVTLSFVADVKAGNASATKKEYAHRIKNSIITHTSSYFLGRKFAEFKKKEILEEVECIII